MNQIDSLYCTVQFYIKFVLYSYCTVIRLIQWENSCFSLVSRSRGRTPASQICRLWSSTKTTHPRLTERGQTHRWERCNSLVNPHITWPWLSDLNDVCVCVFCQISDLEQRLADCTEKMKSLQQQLEDSETHTEKLVHYISQSLTKHPNSQFCSLVCHTCQLFCWNVALLCQRSVILAETPALDEENIL